MMMIVKKIQNICFPGEFGPFLREITFFMSLRRRSLNCLQEHFKLFFFLGNIHVPREKEFKLPQGEF